MKDIFEEKDNISIVVDALSDSHQKLLDGKKQSIEEAYEKIEKEYYWPIYENQKELESGEQLLNDCCNKILEFSKFDRVAIIDAIIDTLNVIENDEFECLEVSSYHYLDDPFDIVSRDKMFLLTSKSIMEESDFSDIKSIGIPRDKEDKFIFIKKKNSPLLNNSVIAFYDSRGDKTIDFKEYDYIYDLINHLINFRYNYKGSEELTDSEYVDETKSFIEHYAFKEYIKNNIAQKKKVKE